MSIEVMSWVWKHSSVQGSALLVLLAMADYANDDGGNIYPAIKTLALKSRLKERAVQHHISQMEESGVIVREREGVGRGNSALWRIILNGAQNAPFTEKVHETTEKVHGSAEKGARDSIEKVHSDAPNPSYDPSIDPPQELFPRSQNQNSGPAVDEWAESPWLRQFLQTQTAINGDKLPRLMDYEFWADLSEAVNGLDLPLLTREFAKMGLWLRDNPARAPTPKGIRRFVAGWFERAYERERRIPNGNSQATQGQRRSHQPGLR